MILSTTEYQVVNARNGHAIRKTSSDHKMVSYSNHLKMFHSVCSSLIYEYASEEIFSASVNCIL